MPEPEGETESSAAADEAKAAEEAAAEAAEAAAEAQAAAEAEEAAAAEEADRILAEKVAAERAKAKAAEKGKIEERASESDLRMEAAIAHANAMAERRSHKSSEESAGNGAPPAAAPSEAPAAAPTPPESSDVIVDVDLATPGAAKFMDTLSDVGSRVGGLGSDDVSDGMYELSRRCGSTMKSSLIAFKEHALDIAIAATSDPPPDQQQVGAVRRAYNKAEVAKLGQLPMALLFAIFTLFCTVAFAVIHFPKKYAPALLHKAKAKAIEYKVYDGAKAAASRLKLASTSAYHSASEAAAPHLAKGMEKAAELYEKTSSTIASSPVASAALEKGLVATSQVRARIAAELLKLKDPPRSGDQLA